MNFLVGLASTALPLAQADSHHSRSWAQAQSHNKQQIHRDTELARRESLRDIWGQRNQKLQTLMIVDTLMFGCGFAILIEGFPPQATPRWAILLYIVSLAFTIGSLFLSVWLCMKMQTRMTKYHIDDQYQAYSCGRFHRDFDSYYNCHCAHLEERATNLYFFGAICLIVCATTLAASRLLLVYGNTVAAAAFITVSAGTLINLAVLPHLYPSETRLQKKAPDALLRRTLSEPDLEIAGDAANSGGWPTVTHSSSLPSPIPSLSSPTGSKSTIRFPPV
eukprot:gb/GEZN01008296.1/.p1 GENE.gb/GEZN01008296.1/~~gb/GEZN01008296.1/.p1  ORF type:complete len:277 (-),score=21.15 gb/GEZN01008296.1/:470-1300(-)